MNQGFDRRTFMAGTAGLTAGGIVSQAAESSPQQPRRLRAAILEFEDRWTEGVTGMKPLLEAANFEVLSLQTDRSPLQQPDSPHLVAFGSFTNNGEEYKQYIERFLTDLQEFVARGGVILEMTQSDQFGNRVAYLPAEMKAVRGDRDLSQVYAIEPDHPLVATWYPQNESSAGGAVGDDFFGRPHVNWESFDRWENMRVLLASSEDATSPCLLEGAHGKGRFLVSSLYVDKCYRGNDVAYGDVAIERGQQFFRAMTNYVELVKRGMAPAVEITPMPPAPPTGPMVGHCDHQSVRIWYRPSDDAHQQERWLLTLVAEDGTTSTVESAIDPDHDFTVVFDAEVMPGTTYNYRVESVSAAGPRSSQEAQQFTSAPAPDSPARVVLGLGSCAPSDPNHVWQTIVDEGCEGFVFLGDTPYVDSNDLHVARTKHRRFLSQPEIARMIARMPCWGTWDDHDFGRNDGHGDFPGKHICRTAFTEYRANASFGHDASGQLQLDRFGDGRGIYTSFRRGPLEVFLLDPRWFSRTEPSWADPQEPTCLGGVQWEWLKQSLLESDATFKALTTGMIWDDKTNSEKDDWHTYRHEREAIFDFIRDNRINGCFLIGGDIHVSRALNYGPRVGYDLWQFIVSPLHGSTIPQLDVPHPSLVHHAVEPYVFLRLEVDDRQTPATLQARWINRDRREIFAVSVTEDQLAASGKDRT